MNTNIRAMNSKQRKKYDIERKRNPKVSIVVRETKKGYHLLLIGQDCGYPKSVFDTSIDRDDNQFGFGANGQPATLLDLTYNVALDNLKDYNDAVAEICGTA